MLNRSSQRAAVALLLILLLNVNLAAQSQSESHSHVCQDRKVPQLTDVTRKVGINFEHVSAAEKKYIVESNAGGVIVIDYDRDGWPDLYFTNSTTVEEARKGKVAKSALYHNNGDGTFTDVTDKAGVGSPCFANGGAVGDFDNDGWPDMFISCIGQNVLYRNNGDGTFTNVTHKAGLDNVSSYTTGAAFGDYDGDGFVDLMITGYVDFHFDDLPGFGKKPTCQFRGIDVQCGPRGLKGATDHLYHNNGNGTFTEVSKQAGVDDPGAYYGLTVIWADFDNSGRPDIYVANDSTPNYLYKNLGNGTFTDVGLESGTAVNADGAEQGSMGVAVGDYRHNGLPSLYVTNFADEYNTLYLNQGKYDFRDVSYDAGVASSTQPWVKWGTAFVDLDNDGWLDLIAVNGHVYPQIDTLPSGARYRQPKNLFMNERNGTFCEAAGLAGPALKEPRVSRGLTVADLDNDGNVDVVVEDIDGAPMVLHNEGVAGKHWVSFEFQGTRSNRLAIGARIKIIAGGTTQTEEVRSGGGYLSQLDFRIHFGLADATKIDSVEIRWPSGRVETVSNLAVDKFYNVLEGAGVVDHSKIAPSRK